MVRLWKFSWLTPNRSSKKYEVTMLNAGAWDSVIDGGRGWMQQIIVLLCNFCSTRLIMFVFCLTVEEKRIMITFRMEKKGQKLFAWIKGIKNYLVVCMIKFNSWISEQFSASISMAVAYSEPVASEREIEIHALQKEKW